jgi:hypothetical protein
MKRNLRAHPLSFLSLSLLGLTIPAALAPAQDKSNVPTGTPVNITVTAGVTPPPPVSITLHERHGHVTPHKGKCTHTGGGLIDVASPSPDTVIITMSGAVVADSSMQFDLDQCFEVSFDDPKLKYAKLTIEGRVIGLLRGERKGCAEYSDACASVGVGTAEVVTVCVPPHSACDCQNLAVNDHDGPKSIPVNPGKYTLHQTFNISAHTDSYLCKRPSAEFAPDPALDPLWISYHEPFHGVKKDTFGFQVLLRVAEDPDQAKAAANGEKKELPAPMLDGKPDAKSEPKPLSRANR